MDGAQPCVGGQCWGAARGAPLLPSERVQAALESLHFGEHVGFISSSALSPSTGASTQFLLMLLSQGGDMTGNKRESLHPRPERISGSLPKTKTAVFVYAPNHKVRFLVM